MTTMLGQSMRTSAMHEWSASRAASWLDIDGMRLPARLHASEREAALVDELALCDESGPRKVAVAGADAAAVVAAAGLAVPDERYAISRAFDGSLVARTAPREVVVQNGPAGGPVTAIRVAGHDARLIDNEDATLVVAGRRARELFAQTCGVDFRNAPLERLIYTRVAGVSCAIAPLPGRAAPVYRLWVDYSYALALWESLVEIVEGLGGGVVGVEGVRTV